MTLTDFLLARIAEDEAVALGASNAPWTAMTMFPTRSEVTNETEIDGGVIVRTPRKDDPDVRHIARHDPTRVLAECEAKRRILAEHEEMSHYNVQPGGGWQPTGYCRTCAQNEDADYNGAPMVKWPCPTLRALASVYADHPDYREEWKP